MESFIGEVVEESLAHKEVLNLCEIVSTRVSPTTEAHKTPWLSQWTLPAIAIPADRAEEIATVMSRSLGKQHPSSWYVDFKSDRYHYVVYPNKVFFIDRASLEQYRAATEYGISIGIPAHQVDFEPHMQRAL